MNIRFFALFMSLIFSGTIYSQIEQMLFEKRYKEIIEYRDKLEKFGFNGQKELSIAFYMTSDVKSAAEVMTNAINIYPGQAKLVDSIYWLNVLKASGGDSLYEELLIKTGYQNVEATYFPEFVLFDTIEYKNFTYNNLGTHEYGLIEVNPNTFLYTSGIKGNKKSLSFGEEHFGIYLISNGEKKILYNNNLTSTEISYISEDLKFGLISQMDINPNKEGNKVVKSYLVFFDSALNVVKEIPFSINSEFHSIAHPYLDRKNNRVYFSSDMEGGFGDVDIYYADFELINNDNLIIGKPVNMGRIVNTEMKETFPYIDRNGILYFSSNGHGGLGGLDILFLIDNKINAIEEPVNSSYDDFFFRNTSNRGSFSSNRTSDDDIYEYFGRNLPIKEVLVVPDSISITWTLEPKISKKLGNKIYLVEIVNGIEQKVDSAYTDENGSVNFNFVKRDNANYSLKLDVNPCGTLLNTSTPQFNSDTVYVSKPNELILGENIAEMVGVQQINYELGSYSLTVESKNLLLRLVNFLKQYPQLELQLTSHTDSRGSSSFNKKLSQNRANSVLEFLVANGIEKKRLESLGFGETQLLNRCKDGVNCSEEEHSINRRTEFIVTRVTPCD